MKKILSYIRRFHRWTIPTAPSTNMFGMTLISGATRWQWWVRNCLKKSLFFANLPLIYARVQVDGITDRSVTYSQLRDHCRALAIRLQTTFRLSFGDTIAVCLPNSIEFPTICLAGNEAGTIVTTVNPIYTAGESNWLKLLSDSRWLCAQVQRIIIVGSELQLIKSK